jgi:hypothetical protein
MSPRVRAGCPESSTSPGHWRQRYPEHTNGDDVITLRALRVLALLAAMGLFACSQEDAIRRFTPPDADARARAYLGLFTAGRVDSAIARLLPGLHGPEADQQLARIGGLLDGQRFGSTHAIGAQTNFFNGVRHVNMTYELHSARGWTVANVATVDSAGGWFVEGVSVTPIDRPLEETTRFTLRGKTAVHYLWLLLTILALVVSQATAVWIASRRAMPRRWRWVLASLIGLGGFSLNWTTGETAIRIINLQLVSAGVVRAGSAAPWILTFALPVGAIAALFRYRRWRASPNVPPTAVSATPEAAV